uniref:Uncharacterized protein n=2 Tax=Desertifilum tharense IPPAS B-1220 TaxID=1781255 RepID=A0A1E5QJK9_9CYAN|nr:hypothetical protein BH720_12955 [Desertifilum tharense IPPAS B-1220]
MTQQSPFPNIENVKQTSTKIKELCSRADAEILILDHLIAQLEAQNSSSPLSFYRLKEAKRFLKLESPTEQSPESSRQ